VYLGYFHGYSSKEIRIAINLRDVPGSLANLCQVIAESSGNILHTYHDRISADVPVGTSRVVLEIETAGHEHIQEILAALKAKRYEVEQDPTCPVM